MNVHMNIVTIFMYDNGMCEYAYYPYEDLKVQSQKKWTGFSVVCVIFMSVITNIDEAYMRLEHKKLLFDVIVVLNN